MLKEYPEITTALIATLTTSILFFLKEFIDGKRQAKEKSEQRLAVFKNYTDPLLLASFSLYERLWEVFDRRKKFLREIAPNNPYYQYRYISTLYRLCVVLGWIQGIKRELSGMDLKGRQKYRSIKDRIKDVQMALAQSQNMEGERLNYLARKWGIDISEMSEEKKVHLEAGIRQLIWDELGEADVNYAYELDDDEQKKLLKNVACLILDEEEIEEETILSHQRTSIRAISRTEAWIYRDWQAAIGDMMLIPIEQENTSRRFDMMGFQEFEDLYLDALEKEQAENEKGALRFVRKRNDFAYGDSKYRWVKRVDALFCDLDLNQDQKFDARIQQLENMGNALIELIYILEDLDKSSDKIDPEKLANMKRFGKEEELELNEES